MSKALVVGGNSGIGLAMVLELLNMNYEKIYMVGKNGLSIEDIPQNMKSNFRKKTKYIQTNLVNCEYDFLKECNDINTLLITCGFGRIAPFEDITTSELNCMIKVNEVSVLNIIKYYYEKICSNKDFYCGVISSIAGIVASPLFSVYGATKSALHSFIENINIELSEKQTQNRILDVAPGALKGTRFYGNENSLKLLSDLPKEILNKMFDRELLYIPSYKETYEDVIDRYKKNPLEFGQDSYKYKLDSKRQSNIPQTKIGYLSGTFDLFHIGHLNLLKRAKQYCDYLIVGVHENGSWKGKETFIPFEERVQILKSIKYVDKVVQSEKEDSDAWSKYHYDYLFVGSDYKGSERFAKYESYFKDKGVEIIYFPYTTTTSSTQLRDKINLSKI